MRPKLSIVTVYLFGSQDNFDKTMISVEAQTDVVDEHILVVSGVTDNTSFHARYGASNRVLVVNKDKSLYHAMNLGLKEVSGDFVLFLNGGDEFVGHDSLTVLLKYCKKHTCLLFRTEQYFGSDSYIRPRLDKLSRLKEFPAHQGFVTPSAIAKKYSYIDVNYAIGSDTLWMKGILKVCDVLVLPDILVKFSLGGVSNAPSMSTCRRRFRESGSFRMGVELLKLCLYKLLGARFYYRLIFSSKYEYKKSFTGTDLY